MTHPIGVFGRYKTTRSPDVERLKGPQHAGNGQVRKDHLFKKSALVRCAMVTTRNPKEISTSQPVGGNRQALDFYSSNSSGDYKKTRLAKLQQAVEGFAPTAQSDQSQRNSGLPNPGNWHGNGGSIVGRKKQKVSSKGNQPKISRISQVGQLGTPGENKRKRDLLDVEIGSWIGKYSSLFQADLYKIAYEKIKSKPGNMTPGEDGETLDGMSNEWIQGTIRKMKDRSFQFKPAVRKLIPKPNGKLRPLGIPTPKDKVVQEAVRTIIEPLFESRFKDSSHGFRPNRSPHTALKQIRGWSGITWMIEGDIKSYFDNIDHYVLANLLEREIKDQNLIALYWKLVKAGYVNNGHREPHSLTGVPQGGVLSPLLSNVYLHPFDVYMEKLKKEYTTAGRLSKVNPKYNKIRLAEKRLRQRKDLNPQELSELKSLTDERCQTPSIQRIGTRLYYCRFADDWVIGITGNKELAERVQNLAEEFLRTELKIELNRKKTKVTHLVSDKALFLGTEIGRRGPKYNESMRTRIGGKIIRKQSSRTVLTAPINKLVSKLQDQGYCDNAGKPKAITKWIYLRPENIISRYNAVLRGILNYYSFVENRNLLQRIVWILRFSACFTLSRKWNISPTKVFKKLGSQLTIKGEKNEVVISLDIPVSLARTPNRFMISSDAKFDPYKVKLYDVRSQSVLDKPCLLCGTVEKVEMHHVKHIRKGPVKGFTQVMAQLNRKQIPVCRSCHKLIHEGKYDGISLKRDPK